MQWFSVLIVVWLHSKVDGDILGWNLNRNFNFKSTNCKHLIIIWTFFRPLCYHSPVRYLRFNYRIIRLSLEFPISLECYYPSHSIVTMIFSIILDVAKYCSIIIKNVILFFYYNYRQILTILFAYPGCTYRRIRCYRPNRRQQIWIPHMRHQRYRTERLDW